ncbi:ThiF family adenylyltransferase [Bradyrhizobium sp. AUGA SZCCT0182]|uniref:ThiF family adenylyltransferase n=1 Tax=Bradyrhizobium sp. AUGA SZCCT0182 TaxID=2807667 RepID=UPI001BA5435B|nr:ThiF family adenylyltransferase [Bradyrhizobium sp. AUGA SZCCT0182]MBR1232080.1 ThiF family adenylyltransferase [Bradyrhizobium sp. AUGA SZCCT0182]
MRAAGQHAICLLKVGLIGLGGTGPVLVQQLARLGVRDYVLIDPDAVETTNLNRLAGVGAADVGAAKIDVAEREIRACSPTAPGRGLRADVVDQNTAAELTGVDFIFLCMRAGPSPASSPCSTS